MFGNPLNDFEVGQEVEKNITVDYEMMFNESNGYGAYAVTDAEDEFSSFNISGVFAKRLIIGQSYLVKGTISIYSNSKQIKVTRVSSSRPQTRRGIITYLKTLDKVGDKRAELIFEKFGLECIDILMNNPDKVKKEIPRVGKDLALNWQSQLKEMLESDKVITRLYDFGLTVNEAKKIYEKLGDNSVDIISENPYILSKTIRGFGFEKCDKLARIIGVKANSPFRIAEGIIHTLKQSSMDGHCFLYKSELCKIAKNFLDVRLTHIEMTKLSREFCGKDVALYSLGSIKYEIPYKDLMMSLNLYNIENKKSKKNELRYKIEDISESSIIECLNSLFEEKRIVIEKKSETLDIDDDRIYLTEHYLNEIRVAMKVFQLADTQNDFEPEVVESVLDEILERDGVVLEEKQREACIGFNTSLGGFCLLIGSAGTGKTFTLKYILNTAIELRKRFSKRNKASINIYAPTGKASKVANKSTGRECSTIHRGLGFNPETNYFNHTEENPLDCNILVCDESSMLDISLAKAFLEAIKNGSLVIFMGDIKQLASVGPGNVLKDIMYSGIAKVVELNVHKRQGVDSGIIENANNIIEKRAIVTCEKTRDAYFLNRETYSGCQKAVIQSVHNILNNVGIEFNEIQILSPQRNGPLGVYMLNYLMQREFNPGNNEVTIPALRFKGRLNERYSEEQIFTLEFKIGDKVINTKNSYDLEQYKLKENGSFEEIGIGVINGECGVIYDIRKTDKNIGGKIKNVTQIIVQYDDFYTIYEDDFGDIEHAYCLTIHKSQGSAWKAVILPFSTSHYNLDNNLIYTAWTRAREFAVAIGSKKSVMMGINKSNASKRNTSLKERLEGKVGLTQL